jgi:hypothetical protein
MVPSLTTILQRLTGEWAMLLQPDAILAVCSEIEYTAWRDRVLTPVTTIQLFLLQILHGNTACSHLPHLSGLQFSAAAYGQARARLPLRFFNLLLERFGSAVQRSALEEGRWHGHRTFLVDGSGCSMPDIPALQEAFGQPTEQRPGCGFPVARLLGLFHAGTGVLLKLVVAPLLTHDLAQVQAVHPSLQEGDVLVADRGLCSYAHLALRVQAGVHAVLRVGARQMVDFTPGRPFVRPSVRRTPAVKGIPRSRWLTALGIHDQLVVWLKPKTCPSWLTREALAALPDSLVLREVRYDLGTPGFRTRQITLVTTLLDAEIYRWPTSPSCTASAGQSRAPNHTTAQESTGTSPRPEVTIRVSALLKLSQWCQRRLDDQPGDVVCARPTTLPPACASPGHPSHEAPGGAAATALGLSAPGESAAAEPDHGSCHRPAQPSSPGGGAR